MRRSFRALLAVMVTMTFAACSLDPMSPAAPSASPSLFLTGESDAPVTLSGTVSASDACAGGSLVLSGNSTYIVAYGELPVCGAPSSDSTTVRAPVADTVGPKLSFE
jgi:hypothetical protein